MKKAERREAIAKVELRAKEGEGLPIIAGYAAVFNERSQYPIEGLFWEEIKPGAFTRALHDPKTDLTACIYHEERKWLPLARFRNCSGTLKLKEDERGLSFEFEPANTVLGRDLVESLKRGDIDGCSFGFYARQDDWSQTYNGLPLRSVIDADLLDISFALTPYYAGAGGGLRSKINFADEAMGEADYRAMLTNALKQDHAVESSARARRLRLVDLT